MKKLPLLLLFLFPVLLSCETSVAQAPPSENEKLVATAKIWGFLKYYHPHVAKGKFDWEEQLFIVMEKVEKTKSDEELSAVFSNWIDSLGEVEKCLSCLEVTTAEGFDKNFDLTWIDSSSFSNELSSKLRHIEKNRVQDGQHYVKIVEGVGNIQVQNEKDYPNFDWTNRDLRLLALFRYWNLVEYFFPYKYQTDMDWDKALEQMLPKFLSPGSERDYHMAMLELATRTNDSHAWFITQETNQYYGYYWAPVVIKMIEGQTVVSSFFDDSLAAKDDWQKGDILVAVNGVPVEDLIAKNEKYMTGSNQPAKYRDLHISLLNGSSPAVEIEILRDGNTIKKEVARYYRRDFKMEAPPTKKWEILEKNIGYVNMGLLEPGDVKRMMKDLRDTRAIIFDIRNYPKGTLYALSNELNDGSHPFVKFTAPDLDYPGKFTWTKPLTAGGRNKNPYTGKIILLVNETTQSHAEFTAMALQTAPNVTTIGSQTAGADGNISDISFLGGFTTYISGIGVFYPDGRETQRIGIVPDIEIKPGIRGINDGRDEVLEKAIEVIDQATAGQ
ncbi:peptidase S41 [Antarcticibacterium flavum]|uniref:Peptidase S41 n=1 Tax=Antarcticibacterium flavum TaxID=2058175 RepID=A0A5B7WZC9_9FLAO|nr:MULTISPECIES: S41 family peptidase [Antarcticibacterium]MCM4161264.1 peptidase S41 [Antarcticibacterium sp. W02-3]QCY68420.1 peptidase S41 [Antarcticibacterium flavum]